MFVLVNECGLRIIHYIFGPNVLMDMNFTCFYSLDKSSSCFAWNNKLPNGNSDKVCVFSIILVQFAWSTSYFLSIYWKRFHSGKMDAFFLHSLITSHSGAFPMDFSPHFLWFASSKSCMLSNPSIIFMVSGCVWILYLAFTLLVVC